MPQRIRKISVYQIFMSQAMRQVKAANPGMKQQDVMRKAAAMYRSRT